MSQNVPEYPRVSLRISQCLRVTQSDQMCLGISRSVSEPCIYLSIHPSAHPFICHPSFHPPRSCITIHSSRQFICPFIVPSICRCTFRDRGRVSIYLSPTLSIHPSIQPAIHPLICLFIWTNVRREEWDDEV